jgi:NAD(P)-dependent dehydrogenase (short-subunit alcohol dehydrogenase family)
MSKEDAPMNKFRLDGKVAVVTGASRGIGRALAVGLAQSGAHVVAVARGKPGLDETVQQIQTEGGTAQVLELDVQDIAAGQAAIDQIAAEHGRLDILVNCAGTNTRDSATDIKPEDFDRIWSVNVRAVLFLSQAAGRIMTKAQSGKIINIASATSFIGLSKVASYASSKGALVQLTRTLATEWSKYGVQVNAVAPGFIRTDFNKKLWENEDIYNWVVGNTPAGRLGAIDDVVGAVQFLASPASDFICGHVLVVDGGFLSGGPWPL